MLACNFESCSSTSHDAEYHQVDPAKLLLESLAKDNEQSEEEDWDVDAKFGNCDRFGGRYHDWEDKIIINQDYTVILGK